MDGRRSIAAIVDRVIDVDPSRVWALVADPERLGEWAGVVAAGYMGTELPKSGQKVFVRARNPLLGRKQRRVEIESWQAGSAVSCVVESRLGPIRFDLVIKPRVETGGIETQVEIMEQMEVSPVLAPVAQRWMDWRLNRMLARISRAASR